MAATKKTKKSSSTMSAMSEILTPAVKQKLAKQAKEQLKNATTQWKSAEKSIRSYVSKNPKQAAALAAGIGAAIGAAATLAMRKRR